MRDKYIENANIFKAFSDPTRLKVLELLQDGERCACMLLEELSIGQSGLSYHMKILCEAGVVSPRQEGKWTHYSLNEEGRDRVIELLREITTPKLTAVGACTCR